MISGVLVMGIGSVTFSLPHFLTTAYSETYSNDGNNSSIENICSSSNKGFGSNGPKNSVLLQSFASRIDNLGSSSEGELLEKLPGLEKIKDLTKGNIRQEYLLHSLNYFQILIRLSLAQILVN